MKIRNMMKAKKRFGFTIMAAALLLNPPSMAAAVPPDLTQGGQPDNEHRWTLGATGVRGWVWSRYVAGGSQNLDARQILVTDVAKGSLADGVLENGDVVTGLKDRAFGVDARILSAQAVTEAEKETNGGVLRACVKITTANCGAFVSEMPMQSACRMHGSSDRFDASIER